MYEQENWLGRQGFDESGFVRSPVHEHLVRRSEMGGLGDAPTVKLHIVRSGGKIRLRPEWGALWVPLREGMCCETAHYRLQCRPGYALVTDAGQEVAVSASALEGSLIVGIVPDQRLLEDVTFELSGTRWGHWGLLPDARWTLPPHLEREPHSVSSGMEAAEPGLIHWGKKLVTARLDAQSAFDSLVHRCPGRRHSTRHGMLCRLLRARIALEMANSPTLETAARVALLSPRRFLFVYREVFGETPLRSNADGRLKSAFNQLSSGRHSVLEVAQNVGYRNRSSFSRAFKERFGVSPAHIKGSACDDASKKALSATTTSSICNASPEPVGCNG